MMYFGAISQPIRQPVAANASIDGNQRTEGRCEADTWGSTHFRRNQPSPFDPTYQAMLRNGHVLFDHRSGVHTRIEILRR